MLDVEDGNVILHLMDISFGEGIGPCKEEELKLLRKLWDMKVVTLQALNSYDHIDSVRQFLKELA